MWELKSPKPVKLIMGILAADQQSLQAALDMIKTKFGDIDFTSEVWPFNQTSYYENQTGPAILRQFVSFSKLISPAKLAKIKLKTNKLERILAAKLRKDVPRPVNLDPGVIEPSKLILATTKNYSHRIYIGKKIYAEVTLIFDKGKWSPFPYTYPDYRQDSYFEFFDKVRSRLLEQLKSTA